MYPKELGDYKNNSLDTYQDKTVAQFREAYLVLHRFEHTDTLNEFVIRNYRPPYHITMGDKIIKVNK